MKDTDILIVTKMKNDRFLDFMTSIRANVRKDTLDRCRFFVCYTGTSDYDFDRLRLALGPDDLCIMEKYRFSNNVNSLSRLGHGKYLVFANDDIYFVQDALTPMIEALEKDSFRKIGTVGCKLNYPDGRIQHMGQKLVIDENDNFLGVTHAFLGLNDIQWFPYPVFGNTFALCSVRRDDFVRLGGLDDEYKSCFEDVHYNLKCLVEGKINLCLGQVNAIHFESATRGKNDITRDDVVRMTDFYDRHKDLVLQNRPFMSMTITEGKPQ